VTIGHGAMVHGCTIASRVLVGIGTIILNGAEIGEDTIVAAGSLVTERMVIPARSLVMGSPARVKRSLTDTEVASILEYSDNYVRYRLDYLDGPGQ
jgi:carbonic anhydrase/acetyltransferase-like protein (isoleucine patch superfamily)